MRQGRKKSSMGSCCVSFLSERLPWPARSVSGFPPNLVYCPPVPLPLPPEPSLSPLGYTSGARVGELFNLTWADIEFEQGRMLIHNREGSSTMPPFVVKDKEARYVQLPTETLNLLSTYQQEAPEGVPYILPTKERYDLILEKWHRCQKRGKQWESRSMMNNVCACQAWMGPP